MISLLLAVVQESGIDTQRFVSLYQSYKNRVYLTASGWYSDPENGISLYAFAE